MPEEPAGPRTLDWILGGAFYLETVANLKQLGPELKICPNDTLMAHHLCLKHPNEHHVVLRTREHWKTFLELGPHI